MGEFEGMNVYVPYQDYTPAQPPRPYVVEGPNHALHFVLSVLTAGLWLPIWLLVALNNHKKIRYL